MPLPAERSLDNNRSSFLPRSRTAGNGYEEFTIKGSACIPRLNIRLPRSERELDRAMERNRFSLLQIFLVFFNVFFHVNVSSGALHDDVRTNAELLYSASNSPWSPSRNPEFVNKVSSSGDEEYVSALTRPVEDERVKGNSRAWGARRQGSRPRFSEQVAETHTSASSGTGVGAESAIAAAQKAFRHYLQRSDYFRARRSQYVPSAKTVSVRSHSNSAPLQVPTTRGRKILASTVASAPVSQHDSSKLEPSSKILEQPFMYLIVSKAGNGDFTTVQDAVDFVPDYNPRRVIIRIRAGFYREQVIVPHVKPYITFHGDGTRSTIISWDATAATNSPMPVAASSRNASEGSALFGTMQSASVTVLSDFFIALNITFQNSAPAPKPGAENSQAVAFLIAGDSAAFYDCSFIGAQDTLYDYKGRHYYHRCFIEGSIDFIFGNGRTLFENCTLSSIATRFGAIAAQQRRTLDEDTGFAFVGCYVTGTGSVYLGRAWSPFAKIVFANTYFEDIIDAEGWNDFGDPSRHDTTYFGLYQCSGPGANPVRLVPWSRNLSSVEVRPYLGQSYVNGEEWLVNSNDN